MSDETMKGISVVLEEAPGDYDPERWKVVGHSAGRTTIGVTAAEKLESGIQYILRLEGDFADGDFVVIQVASAEYWPYEVRMGQLIRLYNGCSPIHISDWLFSCKDGTIRYGSYYFLELNDWGYFECLKYNWDPTTHLERSLENSHVPTGIKRNCLEGLRIVGQKEEVIEALERTLGRIHAQIMNLLGFDPEEHLDPLLKSRDSLVQHCGWGIVSWAYRVFETYRGATSGLILSKECLKPKERK